MLYFISGPVDKDFASGILDNWHLEAYNNSSNTVPVTLKVFDIQSELTLIGDTSRSVAPHTHEYINLSTNGTEHTLVQIEYPEGVGDILLTLYGRDKSSRALPGAIFFNFLLIPLQNSVDA